MTTQHSTTATEAGHDRADDMQPATRALDGGLRPDPVTGAIQPGISMSVNNLFTPGGAAFSAEGAGDLTDLPFLYARWTNPTVRDLERRLASLEGAEAALATATGVAAVAATFLALLKACLLYTSPSPRDRTRSRMPSSA